MRPARRRDGAAGRRPRRRCASSCGRSKASPARCRCAGRARRGSTTAALRPAASGADGVPVGDVGERGDRASGAGTPARRRGDDGDIVARSSWRDGRARAAGARAALRRAARAAGAAPNPARRLDRTSRSGDAGPRAPATTARGATPSAQRARAEAADLRAVRRDGRGADDVAAGGNRRRTQLGLPLLLDSRLELHHRRAARARTATDEATVAVLVVHAGHGAHRAEAARALPARRRRRQRRARRFRWPATAASQPVRVGNGAAGSAARHLRRSASDRVALQRGTPCARCATPAPCSRASPTTCATSGARRTRASGKCAAAPQHFTHSKVMCWVAL